MVPVLLIWITCAGMLEAQQIAINRVNKMPNKPLPYTMRNWKKVAAGYDSLVFDLNASGQYLPMVWTDGNTINYPDHDRFGLHSYVGTPDIWSAEAINVLPAVIGATLAGIDKNDQNGRNWVLMCEEFFNRRPQEGVYLNNFIGSSGSDWWYDTMPNIFFYQLSSLYPGTGDFDHQFLSIAERWLEAVVTMGASAAPWHLPNMDYRAWSLSTMTPLDVGVKEPEAAGAIAWLLYMAYVKTENEDYRLGAEWAIEFLNSRSSNPSYELQMPYGAFIAARMNAELGTAYDIGNMLDWCFEPGNNVRDWGVTAGRWGDYDCHGLVGEAKFSGYAFVMNGFQQVSALVPLVRYDDRFARAIGKWVLNCANASRLFYTPFLPDSHQDSEDWSHQYDPEGYIAYEALRQYALHTGISPFATGDAIREGWAATNLALYGASHVGIFGGIIDTTNISMILKLDLQRTDYFQEHPYPDYLFYNPHDEEKWVEIDAGESTVDLYDAVSNTFLLKGVNGNTSFPVPADQAALLVLVPTGAEITYDLGTMLADGLPVDYRTDQAVVNYPPRIKALAIKSGLLVYGDSTSVYCTAVDRDGDALTYEWSGAGGFTHNGPQVMWTAPDSTGEYLIECTVLDGGGGVEQAQVTVQVVPFINHAPEIDSLTASDKRIQLGGANRFQCYARDTDGDTLSYEWFSEYGTLEEDREIATWTAPGTGGFYMICCTVSDTRGGRTSDSLGMVVYDPSQIGTGFPVLYFPFNGNANDESGHDHHGVVHGVTLTENKSHEANSAYAFNGTFDYIEVPNHTELNFQKAITVSLLMKAEEFYSNRESYPISHGSWENRWKLSITPEKKLRWTVKSTKGIKDLDSSTLLAKEVFYQVITLYDGANMDIYINGLLDAHTIFSGDIMTTDINLSIGQVLPNNNGYNFKGVIDEIRIYNYALSTEEIQNVFKEGTAVHATASGVPDRTALVQNYPNPFNSYTQINYTLESRGRVMIRIVNLLGQEVCTLVDEVKPPGYYTVTWDGRNEQGNPVATGLYCYEMKTDGYFGIRKLLVLK